MKAFKLVPVLLLAAVLFTGCDFFRSILGKPTSKDIERMRIEAEAQARKQRQLDSINKANALNLEKAISEADSQFLQDDAHRYNVIIGSFKVEDNASKMYALLQKNGYKPVRIKFKNGYDVVSVASFDNYQKALAEMDRLLEFEYCPDDVWVYDLHQHLHE